MSRVENDDLPAKDLWQIPNIEIAGYYNQFAAKVYQAVEDWYLQRPTMWFSYDETIDPLHKRQIDNSQRRLNYLKGAAREAEEFRLAIQNDAGSNEANLEVGDIVFYLNIYFSTKLGSSLTLLSPSDVNPSRIKKNFLTVDEEIVLGSIISEKLFFAADKLGRGDSETASGLIQDSWQAIIRYAISNNLDLQTVNESVIDKNNLNYPEEFFNQYSPFIIDEDAINCLELFRRIPGYQRGLTYADELAELLRSNTLWMISGHKDIDVFRGYILTKLEGLKYRQPVYDSRVTMLMKSGVWDDTPLPINR
jgi:hypothetical protein